MDNTNQIRSEMPSKPNVSRQAYESCLDTLFRGSQAKPCQSFEVPAEVPISHALDRLALRSPEGQRHRVVLDLQDWESLTALASVNSPLLELRLLQPPGIGEMKKRDALLPLFQHDGAWLMASELSSGLSDAFEAIGLPRRVFDSSLAGHLCLKVKEIPERFLGSQAECEPSIILQRAKVDQRQRISGERLFQPVAIPDRTLSNHGLDSTPRYDLYASYIGSIQPYELYWREANSPLVHHLRGTTFRDGAAELLLVPKGRCHVISLSFAPDGSPLEAYVNLNLPPEPAENGWTWKDLELDIKLFYDSSRGWIASILDQDEFDAAGLDSNMRQVAIRESLSIFSAVRDGIFPFESSPAPFAGIPGYLLTGAK